VQYLQHLRDKQGMSVQEIIDSHVFLTAGACGPCRFGMYEAEYRLALRAQSRADKIKSRRREERRRATRARAEGFAPAEAYLSHAG